MSSRVLAASIALLMWSTAAHAVSINNRDDKDYKVTIIEGDAKQDHVLKASGAIDAVCMKGCIVRLNDSDSDEYELEGPEVVSIEDGYLYYEGGPEAPAEPRGGDAGQPSQPKK